MANYQELKERTLGSIQEEEAVTVNTRALIDKVLARYSSENTTLRELIQNAADANATTVEIKYETVEDSGEEGSEGLQQLVKTKARRLLVKNDGQAFREEDWQRLKRIAEGNPDETKIGAFGVGFYSVFADTDEPFISSGDQTMAFYWKGNSLFTRRAKMDKADPFTTFFLDYREPSDLPDLATLCQFFATSLTFVKLTTIKLYINDIQMLVLTKKVSPSMPLDLPQDIHPVTTDKLMKIQDVEISRVQLDAKFMNIIYYKPPKAESSVTGFARMLFGRSPTPLLKKNVDQKTLGEYTTDSIFFRICTAAVFTSVSARFAQELERATKKPPPRKTTLSCLTMSKDEQDASQKESEIFENVIPSKHGRIFIGFPTHQTTSIKAHIAAHSVIPTVERENIDLNAKILKTWNAEMLGADRILARIMYIDEMDELKRRAKGLKTSDLEALYGEAIHIMQQFTFELSTPSAMVGEYIAQAFWSCTRHSSIELLSTRGVLPSRQVRLSGDITFLDDLPLLPEQFLVGAQSFIENLKRAGYISEITITDIQNSLSASPLKDERVYAFLKWLSQQLQTGKMDDVQAPILLSGAIAMTPTKDSDGEVVENAIPISLGDIRHYINVSNLSADIPLPSYCLPFSLTKKLSVEDFTALGWKELEVADWVFYMANNSSKFPVEYNLEISPQFAGQVLAIISKNWERLSSTHKLLIIDALKVKKCIPTKQGMRLPKESYFSSVKLFTDLPTIHGVRNVKDKVLTDLGMRKTVELKLVFERLMGENAAGSGEKWSHVDLIKYLSSVKSDIPYEDIQKLRKMEMCKAEPSKSSKLYKVCDLYEPLAPLRSLNLPVLYWPGEWKEQSPEAKFLRNLGLSPIPSDEVLLKIASGPDKTLREKALRYFVDHYHLNNYSRTLVASTPHAFLPLQNNTRTLATPVQCYSNSESSILGFDIIRNDLQPHAMKFGVKSDPDMRECVKRLTENPPAGPREAQTIFGYFANRLKDLTTEIATHLGSSCIVPIRGSSGTRYIMPRICYIGSKDHKYAKVFDFVDFGTGPNAFLMHCGSKPEPTTAEIAYRMAKEPDRLYEVFQSEEKYLSMLRTIASDWHSLKRDKELVKSLRVSPCLGAYREIPMGHDVQDDDQAVREFQLAKAEDIFIIDDISGYHLFRNDVLAAPEEEELEGFYCSLGASVLSDSIQKHISLGPVAPRTVRLIDLQKLVLERTRLFMHSNSEGASHDARWLENNLEVEQVEFIKNKIFFSPKGVQKNSTCVNKTAAIVASKRLDKKYTLNVTPKWEFYDIAATIVRLVLKRPKMHSSLLLESLLSTDLLTLKHRGYNVDRILARKQAEAVLMEQARLKKVEEQRKVLELREMQRQEHQRQEHQRQDQHHHQQQQQNHRDIDDEKNVVMPGSFTDSPKRQRNPPDSTEESGNFLTRGFSKISKMIQESDNRGKDVGQNQPEVAQETRESIHSEGVKPTAPHRISTNLQRAIQAGRSHASSSVFTQPKTFDVREDKTFCDNRPGQDITYAAQTSTGMKVYTHNALTEQIRKEFIGNNAKALHVFSLLLNDIAEVFTLAPAVLHIYYHPDSETIAFNLDGALFCNIAFFLRLHAAEFISNNWSRGPFLYWWVTVCHELAHNISKEHGSKHSFYTESFVNEYFSPAMDMVLAKESKGKQRTEKVVKEKESLI